MTARRISWARMAVVVGMIALAPLRGVALPSDEEPDPLPVFGAVLPTGVFIGTLKIIACTLDETGHLHLTGVLNGTATRLHGARLPVAQELFTALATLHDPGRTTDVVRLAIAPIALDHLGVVIRLTPITIDIYALPGAGDWLETLLPLP
jgi:hypothetical protein